MIEFTKAEKRELRTLAAEAYKVELEKEVANLEAAFMSWRDDKIGVFDLDNRIHAYYDGPRKQLYRFYQMRNKPETAVARALALVLINADQISTEIKSKIQDMIEFFKENK